MQNERNAFKAGLFIIASVVLALGVIIAIKGVGRFLEPMQHPTVRFTLKDNVGGLSPGDEVRIGGAKVGVVRNVEIIENGDGTQSIDIAFTFPQRFELHKDATVAIESTVTGVSVLNFSSLGTGQALADGETLTGRSSALTALFESAPEIAALVRDIRGVTVPKVNAGLDRATETITTFNTTGQTATDFIKDLKLRLDPITQRYYAVADTAKTALQNVGDLFGDTRSDFRTTVANLRDATGTVKERLPSVMDKVDGLLTNVTSAVNSTNAALEDVKKIAANTREVSGTARQVLVGNRGKIDGMIAALKATGDNLKAASSEVRRSPWRLLYKPAPGEMANLNLYDSARQFAEGAGQLNDAALALRDALKDPQAQDADVQKLVDKLDDTFANFSAIEQQLWEQVKE
jgi:phospholipid/cholesterol/gamma-HCH transport system substrate-binding protein